MSTKPLGYAVETALAARKRVAASAAAIIGNADDYHAGRIDGEIFARRATALWDSVHRSDVEAVLDIIRLESARKPNTRERTDMALRGKRRLVPTAIPAIGDVLVIAGLRHTLVEVITSGRGPLAIVHYRFRDEHGCITWVPSRGLDRRTA